jgi:hypothetical protein
MAPRFDKPSGSFLLQLSSRHIDADISASEPRQHFLTVDTTGWQFRREFFELGERFKSRLGHCAC